MRQKNEQKTTTTTTTKEMGEKNNYNKKKGYREKGCQAAARAQTLLDCTGV